MQHSEQYRKQTAALPLNRQLALLQSAWTHAVQGQLDMGFSRAIIIEGLHLFLAEQRQKGPETIQ